MRTLGVVLVTVLVVGVVLAAVDLAFTRRAEEEASRRVSEEIGAAADVELEGWPVSLRLLVGRVPHVVVTAAGVPIPEREAELEALEVELADARLRLGELASNEIPVEARSGTFVARIDSDDLFRLIDPPPFVERFVLDDGVIRAEVNGEQLGLGVLGVDVEAQASGGDLVLQPVNTPIDIGAFTISLAELPGGAEITEVDVETGDLVLSGVVRDLVIPSG